jgi:hypothetical protein
VLNLVRFGFFAKSQQSNENTKNCSGDGAEAEHHNRRRNQSWNDVDQVPEHVQNSFHQAFSKQNFVSISGLILPFSDNSMPSH